MKNQETSIKVRKGHGPVIKGAEIQLSSGKCIALFELIQRAEAKYAEADVSSVNGKGDSFDIKINETESLDPVVAMTETLRAFIAPVLTALDLQTSVDAYNSIIKESKELCESMNE